MEESIEQFSDRLAALIDQLRQLSDSLSPEAARPHRFRWAAQEQAFNASLAMKIWVETGEQGELSVPQHMVRAAIYSLAHPATQLRAFLSTWRVASLKHSEGSRAALEQSNFLVGFGLLRGLFERIGHAALLARTLRPLVEPQVDQIGFNRIIEFGDVITRSLYTTTFEWELLAIADFQSSDPKSVKYKKNENKVDLSARSTMNGIDALNERRSGTRLSYEFLCDFLHPNIGDLLTSSISVESHTDKWGTRTLQREIACGRSDFSGQLDVTAAVANFLHSAKAVVAEAPYVLGELAAASRVADRATTEAIHRVGRKQKALFRADDLCPCLSGRTWWACGAVLRPRSSQ